MDTGKPVVVGEAVGAWARYLASGVWRGEKTAKTKIGDDLATSRLPKCFWGGARTKMRARVRVRVRVRAGLQGGVDGRRCVP